MSNQDASFSVIDPNWLMGPDFHEYLQPIPSMGMSEQRRDEYRLLFSRAHLSQGLRRDPKSGDIFFIVQSVGILDRGYSNGYLYCGPGRVHSYPACSSGEQSGEHVHRQGDDYPGYKYRKLANRWYAYRNGPG